MNNFHGNLRFLIERKKKLSKLSKSFWCIIIIWSFLAFVINLHHRTHTRFYLELCHHLIISLRVCMQWYWCWVTWKFSDFRLKIELVRYYLKVYEKKERKKKLQSHYIQTTIVAPLCSNVKLLLFTSGHSICICVVGGVKLFSFLPFMQCFPGIAEKCYKETQTHQRDVRWKIFMNEFRTVNTVSFYVWCKGLKY